MFLSLFALFTSASLATTPTLDDPGAFSCSGGWSTVIDQDGDAWHIDTCSQDDDATRVALAEFAADLYPLVTTERLSAGSRITSAMLARHHVTLPAGVTNLRIASNNATTTALRTNLDFVVGEAGECLEATTRYCVSFEIWGTTITICVGCDDRSCSITISY